MAGLLGLGQPQSFRLPGDYLGPGPLGWVTPVVFVLGALSPVLTAILAARRRGEEPSAAQVPE